MADTTTGILNSLRVLVHALQVGSRTAEEQAGITGAQLFVLENLEDAGSLSVNDLARLTHTHQSTVSVVISKLVKKGLVERVRSEKDARVQMISITKKGEQRLKSARRTVQDKLIRSVKQLSDADRTRLNQTLRKVLAGAGLAELEPQLFLENKR